MRVTVLALLLLARGAHAERGHQAYMDQIERSARAHEEWINKPCTPRGRLLVKATHKLGTATLWSYRLHTTGYWRMTVGPLAITKSGCDTTRQRRVHVHWH